MDRAFTLIKRDGSRIQAPFLMVDGVPHISEHIAELEFAEHETGKLLAFEPTLHLFENIRAKVGGPVRINSGYRSREYQQKLYDADVKAHGGKPSGQVARPGHSPHETGSAMDLAVPSGYNAESFAKLIQNVSREMGLPAARVGWKAYNGSFVHTDLAFLLFYPYTKEPNPNLPAWNPGVCW